MRISATKFSLIAFSLSTKSHLSENRWLFLHVVIETVGDKRQSDKC